MAGEPLLNRGILGIVVASESDAQTQDAVRSDIAAKLALSLDRPIVRVGANPATPWIAGLPEQLASLQSRSLLLFGTLLEGAVTQIALSALLDGYDVFLASDLTTTEEPAYRETFLSRIRVCGGTIVTIRQAMRELLAVDAGHRDCTDLARLMSDFSSSMGDNITD